MHRNGSKAARSRYLKSGALLCATFILLVQGLVSASNILFVSSSATWTGADSALNVILIGMGHTVTLKTDIASATTDASGRDLVIVSATVGSTNVNTKFKTVTQPVLTWENAIFDDMGMTGATAGNYGTLAGQTQFTITNSSHQLAAGQTGSPTVFSSGDPLAFGLNTALGTGVQSVATVVGDATKIVLFGYPSGAAMVGLTAPGRRTGFFSESGGALKFTAAGTALFKAAVNWSLSITPPSITTQPAAQTVNQGAAATFSVVAAGTATLTYQWYKNGTAISGAINASYTTPATVAGDNGANFSVVVNNASATPVTSANAALTVIISPSITTQPANQTVTAPATATFSVTATGTAPLTYQWKKGGTAISGATNASYTTPATVTGDNGAIFTVTITNTAGSVTSGNATLTVNSAAVAPSITTQPASQIVVIGTAATFTVVASGTAPLSYQWRKNAVSISGATSASYTTPPTVAGDDGSIYSVVVTNSAGSVTSSNATLSCGTAPSITTQPANQTVTVGQTATFSVVAAGTATLTYQWKKGGTAISGATLASYTTPATVSGDNGAIFTVTVTNSYGSVTSGNTTLTVNAAPVAPSITTQPANQSVTVGSAVTFTVVASGTAPLSYQWKRGGTNIGGATSASYTISTTVAGDDAAVFYVVVTNSAGFVTSANATLTCNTPPAITTQPANQSVSVGQTATFTVVATGTAPLAYQWKRNGSNVGTNSTTYTTPVTVLGDNGAIYTVVVSNVTPSTATSNNAILTVTSIPPPSITVQPVDQTVAEGQAGTFSVSATSSQTMSYQWQKGGVNISGATASTYITPAVSPADNGALFTCVVSASAGSATTAAAKLLVVKTKVVLGTVNGASPLVDVAATYGAGSSGTRTGAKVSATNGASNSGSMTGLEVNATEGATDGGSITGANITATKSASNTGAPAVGLHVKATDPRAAGAYAGLFEGKVGINNLTPSEALDVIGNLRVGSILAGGEIGIGYNLNAKNSWKFKTDITNTWPDTTTNLILERADGKEVFTVEYTQPNEDPFLTFNKKMTVYGPWINSPNEHLISRLNFDYMGGIDIERMHFDHGLNTESYSAILDHQSLAFTELDYVQPGSDGKVQAETFIHTGDLELHTLIAQYGNSAGDLDLHTAMTSDGISIERTEQGTITGSMVINSSGIETTGNITANQFHADDFVSTKRWKVPDYVFEAGYRLQSLDSVDSFVKKNKHLPNVPSAQEIGEKGLDLAEMNVKLLEKVEELTLHVIAMDKEIKQQHRKNARLEKQVKSLAQAGKGSVK